MSAAPSPQKQLGLRLRQLRMAGGITQEEFAYRLGMAVQNLRRIEQGRIDVRLSTVFRLAEALSLDEPGELLRKPTIPNPGRGRPRKS